MSRHNLKIYAVLLLLSITLGSRGAVTDTADYFNTNYLRYSNYVYKPGIRTVRLEKPDDELSTPLLELGKGDQLRLSFDDFEGDVKDLHYTFVHCDANWKPSDLLPAQYINGFTDDRISNYAFSFNTLQHYTHYNLLFPTADMQPTLSGNYLLKVYLGSDQDNLIITRIFRVVEPRIDVKANIHRATIVNDRDSKQEVDFSIVYSGYRIDDVYNGLKVVISQNDRMDNAISGLKPRFVKENELVYDYDRENVFNGGNEFRFFDIRTLKFQTERIAAVSFDSLNKVQLYADDDRSAKRYSIIPDINGKYTVKIREKTNSDIEADYVLVHFSLPYDFPLTDGNLYIFGQLSEWTFKEECKMKYDLSDRTYKGDVYLKQGYYDYEYAYVKDGTQKADETYVEGNHFETDNDYTIYVYDKPQGSRYDKLIGAKKFNSRSFY